MKIKAYILAADPAWIQASVLSYYAIPDEIIVSYDANGIGFTGVPVAVDQCLQRLRAIDTAGKMRFVPGEYARPGKPPMESEVLQRQSALKEIGTDVDWILQFDTDEILPDAAEFLRCLHAVPPDAQSVDWPMRALFRQVGADEFLEVCTARGRQSNEYPGPVACRPGIEFEGLGRRVPGPLWRFGSRHIGWRPRPHFVADQSDTSAIISRHQAILHFSWVRTEAEIRRKLQSWSHSGDFDAETFLNHAWLPAAKNWKALRNFHPIHPELWPALRRVKIPPRFWKEHAAAPHASIFQASQTISNGTP